MATTITLFDLPIELAKPESGGHPMPLVPNGSIGEGIGFASGVDQSVLWLKRMPTLATSTLGTGATISLAVTQDPANNDGAATVAVFAVNFKLITSGTDVVSATGVGTEATGNITMNATSGVIVTASIAIAVANMDSVAAATWCLVRVRRLGTNSSDTCKGRVLLLGAAAFDT